MVALLGIVNTVAPLIIIMFLGGNAILAFFAPALARRIVVGKRGRPASEIGPANPSDGYIRLIGAMMLVIVAVVAAGLLL